eukprot:443480-Amphidinium_carterae.1
MLSSRCLQNFGNGYECNGRQLPKSGKKNFGKGRLGLDSCESTCLRHPSDRTSTPRRTVWGYKV